MKITIRSKLVMAISALMIAIFSLAAYLFINEKKVQMADDIRTNMESFAEITASNITHYYDLYLSQNGFVYFNKEMRSIFDQNENLKYLKVVSYDGTVLYDSLTDIEKKYSGSPRNIGGSFLDQIKSENISFRTLAGDVLFIKQSSDAFNPGRVYVDKEEVVVPELKSGTFVEYFVVPANERYSVVYGVNYDLLQERVDLMVRRMIYLALFAIMLGMIMSFFMSSNLVRPIGKLVVGAGEIAKGNFKTRVDIQTSDEISYLGGAFNKMAEDLEKSIEAKLFKERVAHELKIASEIQNRIIPDKLPVMPGLDIAAGIIPATEIGGDMYDFLPSGDDRLLMYLGDVTGHGVPAGIVGSIANALFYGYCGEMDLVKLMTDVNHVMKAKTMANMFMTLVLTEWNSKDKKFKYISAGHEQIIHYRAKDKKIELAPAGGIALGMVADISKLAKVQEIDFQPGDFLVIYSDGIPEAWNNNNECYGMERFLKACESFGNLETAVAIKEAILYDVEQFVDAHEQVDDVTLVVLKRTA